MAKRRGSNFERRGMRVAAFMGVIGLGVVGFFLIRGAGSGSPVLEQDVPPPPPGPGHLAPGPNGLMAGEGMRIQFTDPEDPSKVTGELRSESVEPQEARRYLVVEPRLWLYQDDGSTVMVRAANGRLYMPSQSQEPESGRLEGGVIVHVYEARADGSRVTSEGEDEPTLVAETEWLDFDMALGEASTDSTLTVDTEQVSFEGHRMRARFDELREQLVFLEVLEGGFITYAPEEGASEGSPAAPAEKPIAKADPPAKAKGRSKPAPAPVEPEPVLYYTTFEHEVVLWQQGRALEADLLEIWARTYDNTLKEGAIRRVEFAETAGQQVRAPAAPLMPSFVPAVASMALAVTQAESVTQASANPDLITLEWTGPLRIQPIERAEELVDDDLTVRFSSETPGGVTMRDEESEARGAMSSLSYRATTGRVDAVGRPDTLGWLEAPDRGRVEFERAHVDLVNGLVSLTGRTLARASEGSEITCTHGADLALHFIDSKVSALLREAIFNGDVVATNGEASAIGEIARSSFVLDEDVDGGVISRLEQFHLEGDDSDAARLVQGEDESLEGRVIDVSLVPGPDDEPDPSVVTVVGDVRGRQGDAELTAGALEATLSRDDEGELVVDSAFADGGVHFTRARDEIEISAESLRAWPEEERVTIAGEHSMVRRGTAGIHGRQIDLDGASRKVNVFGAGRFEDELGSGATATWSREMLFDDAQGLLECHGDVVAVIVRDERTRDTIRAMRVFARLAPVEAEVATDGLGALDGSLDELIGERRLVSAEAVGEVEEVEGGLPAIIQSIEHDASGEGDRPARALLLEGPRIKIDDGGDRLDVPAAGRLVVADQREATEPASEEDIASSRGQAMFTWKGDFSFDRATGEALMQRGVRATMIESGVSRVTLLDAERMTAMLAEDETDQPTLTGAKAEGAVYLAQKSDGLTSFEVIADRLSLDNVAKTAEATSSPGNVVTVFEGTRPTPATARMFFFDLAKGRWEIRDMGTVRTPR